jgi:hypothetical protein
LASGTQVAVGTKLEIIATPQNKLGSYELQGVYATVDGTTTELFANSGGSFDYEVIGDVNIYADFVDQSAYKPLLRATDMTNGKVKFTDANGNEITDSHVTSGTVVTIIPVPDSDYRTESVSANGTALTANEDGTYTYTVNADTKIAATFAEKYAHYTGTLQQKTTNLDLRERYVTTITLTGTQSSGTVTDLPTSNSSSPRDVWQDKTDVIINVYSGETLNVDCTAGKGWSMYKYFYIDYNNNGIFDFNDDELVAQTSTGGNFLGSGTDGNPLPSFTLPNLATGKYRCRFKVDWDCTDPYGNMDSSNLIYLNGGEIIDFYINVVKTEHTVTIEQVDGGSISVTKDGETVNSNDVVNSGEKLKIAVSPKDDYLVKAVTVNGDAISADADGYYYYTVDGVDFTIAAEFVLKSEYKLTVNFAQPTEGGKIVVKADGAEIESGAEIAYETPITIEATPNTFAWQVGSITLNGSALDADNDAYTFTLTEDATIAATFETKYTHNDATIKMESVQNTNRSVFGITLTNEKNVERGKVSLTEISEGDTRALWQDMTAQSIKVCPGDVLTISVKGMGCDLGEYLYIDWNNNYKFECQYEAGKDLVTNYPSNELVSYNMDRINGNFYNSKGETVDRTNNTEGLIDGPYFYLPSFTVPNVEPGKYYARFKIDWADNDPDKAGTGCAGEIIDFVIEVENEHTVSVAVPETNQKYGNVKIVGGTENATSINTLTDVTVEAEATGYAISFMCWTDDAGNIVSKDTQYTYTGNENSTLTAHFGYKVWGQVNGNGKLTFSKEKKYELAANLGKKKSAPAFASDEETESNSTTTTDNGVDPTVTLNASVGDNLDDMTLTATDDNGTAGLFEAGKTLYVNTKADGSQKIGLVYVINSISQTIVKEYNYTDDDDVNALSLELDMAIPYDVSVYYYDNIATGVEDIAVDAEAEAEYYNLNGVRVTGDLVPGVYIRRAADKTEKVIIK